MEFQTGYYSRNYALPLPPFLESVDAPELQNGPICPPKFQVRLPGSPPVSPTEDIPFVRVEEGEREKGHRNVKRRIQFGFQRVPRPEEHLAFKILELK